MFMYIYVVEFMSCAQIGSKNGPTKPRWVKPSSLTINTIIWRPKIPPDHWSWTLSKVGTHINYSVT